MIVTVTGSVPVETIGITDCHSHAWIDPVAGGASDAPVLNSFDAIQAELTAFRQVGGRLLVDCQPGGCGRDVRRLVRLSQATGLLITSVTGFHMQKYYPPENRLWQATADQAARHFIRELTEGAAESEFTIPATAIKIGYSGETEGQSRVLMEAVAAASRETGAAILFHTEAGKNIEALIPFFAAQGVPPRRLYVCHVDKRPDLGLHRELIKAGVLLGYDTFLRPKYDPDNGVWKLIPALVSEGLAHGIAIALDPAFPNLWAFGGGHGPRALAEIVLPRLRREGIDEASISAMLGRALARRFVRTADDAI